MGGGEGMEDQRYGKVEPLVVEGVEGIGVGDGLGGFEVDLGRLGEAVCVTEGSLPPPNVTVLD